MFVREVEVHATAVVVDLGHATGDHQSGDPPLETVFGDAAFDVAAKGETLVPREGRLERFRHDVELHGKVL